LISRARPRCPLVLDRCYLDGELPVSLDFGEVTVVGLTGCKLPGLFGKTLKVSKHLNLAASDIKSALVCPGAQRGGAITREGKSHSLFGQWVKVGGRRG